MKTKLQRLLGLFGVLAMALQATAQGTAFNYQGALSANGVPANGSYDLAFTLYDSTNTPGNVIAGPLTNVATPVSNGLFTVTLDFGTGVFNGSNYWLDISVSPSGSNTFTELSPRWPLTSVPYAVYAANASNVSGTVSAGQLSGVVNNSQLANNSITLNPGSGLGGGGGVALGGSVTLSNTGVLSVTGNSDITVSTVGGQVTLGDTSTSDDTPNTIVQRDVNGDFSAGTLTLTGTLNMGNYNFNTGIGLGAFGNNTSGGNNTSLGALAIGTGTTGENNTALGAFALVQSVSGDNNTAAGAFALVGNTTGENNTAFGEESLAENTTGSNNIGEGFLAGYNLTTGNSNIDIGNPGLAGDDSIIRIGINQNQAFIAGVINGNGGGLTNLNAAQLTGTLPSAQLPAGVITNNTTNVVLDGTFTENGASVVTNNSFSNILGGTFFGNFVSGGSGTNFINNVTVIGTNTPIWSADGNTFPQPWLALYTGQGAGYQGIGLYGDFRNGTNGERYGMTLGGNGGMTLNGYIAIVGADGIFSGIPDAGSTMLTIGDDVDHGVVQAVTAGHAWAYQLFSSPQGGLSTNSDYTNGMETMQILGDGQITLLQPWQFEDGPHIQLLLSEAQTNQPESSATGKTNTFGIEVYNGLLSIGPVTGSGVNTNGTNWTGTNATMAATALTMDTNGNVSAGTITASNFNGNGSGLTNLAVPYVTGYSSSLTLQSSKNYYLPLCGGSATTTEAEVETPMAAGTHGDLYVGIYNLGAGTNVVFTIMTNGAPSEVSCSIVGNGTAAMQWASGAGAFIAESNGLPASIRTLSDNPVSSSSNHVSWMLKY